MYDIENPLECKMVEIKNPKLFHEESQRPRKKKRGINIEAD